MNKDIAKDDENVILIRSLMALEGMSVSSAAKLMSVQRTNLSSWLSGKLNVFSINKIEGMFKAFGVTAFNETLTGRSLRFLSSEKLHVWKVDSEILNLDFALKALIQKSSLEDIEIFNVDTRQDSINIKLNLIRINDISSQVLILVCNKHYQSEHYPISQKCLSMLGLIGTVKIAHVNTPFTQVTQWLKGNESSVNAINNQLDGLLQTKDAETLEKVTDSSIEIKLSYNQAIAYAIDSRENAATFLSMWREGDWASISKEFPDFELGKHQPDSNQPKKIKP